VERLEPFFQPYGRAPLLVVTGNRRLTLLCQIPALRPRAGCHPLNDNDLWETNAGVAELNKAGLIRERAPIKGKRLWLADFDFHEIGMYRI
jgi:hypothetical protein